VAEVAGRALKKIVLELGGSDPFIVLADADVAAAAKQAAAARVINNGQSCIAAKRFIVAKPWPRRSSKAFRAALASLRVGDPLERDTDVGRWRAPTWSTTWTGRSASLSRPGATRPGRPRLERPAVLPPTLLTGCCRHAGVRRGDFRAAGRGHARPRTSSTRWSSRITPGSASARACGRPTLQVALELARSLESAACS
jgi:hypothetical protein